MNVYDAQISYLRDKLFNYPIIDEMDDDLILLSMIEPSKILDRQLKDKLIRKFKTSNNDALEFLGDAILELIISEMIFDKGLSVNKMSNLRQSIVRNVSLICLMNDLQLCDVNQLVTKSCADLFEAIVGAVYTHLKNYDVNPIKVMIQWFIDVWHMDFIIDDMINHPNDQNVCSSVQRFYHDLILEPPNLDHIKSYYGKLQAIYAYYRLGTVKLVEKHVNRMWNVKVECPLTLGCQYYEEKIGDRLYISSQFDQNKQQAIEKASMHAIDVILNDYELK